MTRRYFLILAALYLPLPGWGEAQRHPGYLIYHQGRTQGAAYATVAGGIRVLVGRFPCLACHGEDGRGGSEGGVKIPSIRWRDLSRPLPGIRPAYTPEALNLAVTAGISANGRVLNGMMPRYHLRSQDLKHLREYLRVIHQTPGPGVGLDEIRIATLVPITGSRAGIGRVIVEVLRAYFERINKEGGIYGRKLVLIVAHEGEKERKGYDDVLCLLSPVLADREHESTLSEDLPILFPLGPERGAVTNLAMVADLRDQAQTLLTWRLRHPHSRTTRVVVVVGEDQIPLGKGLISMGAARNVEVEVLRLSLPASSSLTGKLELGEDEALFWFAGPGFSSALVAWLQGRTLATNLYTSIDLVVPILDVLTRFRDLRLTIADPRGGMGSESPGSREFAAFRDHLRDEIRSHGTLVRYVYTAAALLSEGLKRAGRRIDRGLLLETMQQIHSFRSGAMPPIDLAPHLTRPSRILIYSHAGLEFQVAAPWFVPPQGQ